MTLRKLEHVSSVEVTAEFWCDNTTETFGDSDEVYVVMRIAQGDSIRAPRSGHWDMNDDGRDENRHHYGPYSLGLVSLASGLPVSMDITIYDEDGNSSENDRIGTVTLIATPAGGGQQYSWSPGAECTHHEVQEGGSAFVTRLVGAGSSYKVTFRAAQRG